MIEFALTFLFLVAITAMMAIGVMRGRAPISGTCGGLNNIGADGECEICGGDSAKCKELRPE
ncbi:MAG: (Na+)-NQR maturation NqrM [Gammaproteobacteria bacterium]|nr:(Na+)-NQR maturation NqrM [Gammaproteobacteria bacterium]